MGIAARSAAAVTRPNKVSYRATYYNNTCNYLVLHVFSLLISSQLERIVEFFAARIAWEKGGLFQLSSIPFLHQSRPFSHALPILGLRLHLLDSLSSAKNAICDKARTTKRHYCPGIKTTRLNINTYGVHNMDTC